jgi:di/tricarboxylate transporter
VVALIALIGTGLSGLVEPQALFAGFGHPAVLTVAAALMISAGLERAGVIAIAAGQVQRFTATPFLHLLALTGIVTLASAFMNNVGALALLMPVAIGTARQAGRAPGYFLMPMAFGALLGGMTTLMGTPPNLIISGFRENAMGTPFGVFDFAWVGLPVALAGLAFLLLAGPRLLPARAREGGGTAAAFDVGTYTVELILPEGSKLAGGILRDVGHDNGLVVTAILREGRILPAFNFRRLQEGDILLIRGAVEEIEEVAGRLGLEIARGDRAVDPATFEREGHEATEVLVARRSSLIGRPVREFSYLAGDRALVVGLAREDTDVTDRLGEMRFRAGDILLVHGETDALPDLMLRFDLLPLAARDLNLGRPRRVLPAVAIFGAALAATVAGLVPITLAFFATVVGFLLTKVLRAETLYDGVDWSVIVLLGAMFPLGMALETSGASRMAAEALLGLGDLPQWVLLGAVLVVTMLVSDVVNNAATALLMAPISISIASATGASPDMYLMAVAIGASCAFLTPIGHQANTLVMGPGGYRFSDYWPLGLPLEIVIVVVSVPLLLVLWG